MVYSSKCPLDALSHGPPCSTPTRRQANNSPARPPKPPREGSSPLSRLTAGRLLQEAPLDSLPRVSSSRASTARLHVPCCASIPTDGDACGTHLLCVYLSCVSHVHMDVQAPAAMGSHVHVWEISPLRSCVHMCVIYICGFTHAHTRDLTHVLVCARVCVCVHVQTQTPAPGGERARLAWGAP